MHRDSDKRSFITTDAPLILTTTERRENNFWGIGFANADALVFFPLCESCVLAIFGQDGTTDHIAIDQTWTRQINLVVADRCKQYLVGRDEELVHSLAKFLGLHKKQWQPKMRVS